MKKLLLVLVCLLLCGCARSTPEAPPPPPAETTAPSEPLLQCRMEPEAPIRRHYPEGLEVYLLSQSNVHSIFPWEDHILLFSGEDRTTVSLLHGEDFSVSDAVTLDFALSPEDPSLHFTDSGLSFYDPTRQQSILWNPRLQEVRHISITEPISGTPVLSADCATLYYCTGNAIRARDLDSGIHRTVKELSYDDQAIVGVHLQDTVLQCRIQDGDAVRTLFLSAQTGQLLSLQEGDVSLLTQEDAYYAALPVSGLDMLIYGNTATTPMALYPEDLSAKYFYLPQNQALVTASLRSDGQVQLCCYSLRSGSITAALTLPSLQTVKDVDSASDGSVLILAHDPEQTRDVLYRWNASSPVFAPEDSSSVYALPYPGTDPADNGNLALCRTYAAQLAKKYGLQILIGEEAAQVQPWDYSFDAETLPQVLHSELRLLDQRLSRYPQTLLDQTQAHFSSLKLCLVRQITGTAASGSLDTATGIQFLEGTDAYVVITVGKYAEQALYHELFHVMETHILTESSALDQWTQWNPTDFDYSYGYAPKDIPDSYLSGSSRSFVDLYSMTYPKEDRARIFEAAMLPGNAELFAAENLQGKLTALCEGIRQAYRLRKVPDPFPWEQYLDISFA